MGISLPGKLLSQDSTLGQHSFQISDCDGSKENEPMVSNKPPLFGKTVLLIFELTLVLAERHVYHLAIGYTMDLELVFLGKYHQSKKIIWLAQSLL